MSESRPKTFNLERKGYNKLEVDIHLVKLQTQMALTEEELNRRLARSEAERAEAELAVGELAARLDACAAQLEAARIREVQFDRKMAELRREADRLREFARTRERKVADLEHALDETFRQAPAALQAAKPSGEELADKLRLLGEELSASLEDLRTAMDSYDPSKE